jgi:hypothetical protein
LQLDLVSAFQAAERSRTFAEFTIAMTPLFKYEGLLDQQETTGRLLDRYCLNTVSLCMFHIKQALRREANNARCGAKVDKQQLVTEFIEVLRAPNPSSFEKAWSGYTTRWKPDLLLSAEGKPLWIDFLENNWLTPSWLPLCAAVYRNSVPHYGIETSNEKNRSVP